VHGAPIARRSRRGVALAALRDDKTMAERCKDFELHASQVIEWQRQLLEGAADVFAGSGQAAAPVDLAPLHAKIGQLALENSRPMRASAPRTRTSPSTWTGTTPCEPIPASITPRRTSTTSPICRHRRWLQETSSEVRPELPTASVGSSQVPTSAVDNAAPFSNRPHSTSRSGNAV
jgi:transposase-like protein